MNHKGMSMVSPNTHPSPKQIFALHLHLNPFHIHEPKFSKYIMYWAPKIF